MSTRWEKFSMLFVLMLLGILFVFLPSLVSASREVNNPLPPPIPPEPYPNSDIYPAEVYLESPDDLKLLYQLNIDMEGIRPADGTRSPGAEFEPAIVTIYINPTQSDALFSAGLSHVPILNEGYRSGLLYGPGSGAPNAWPTFEQYVTRMQALESAYPLIVRLVSIGTSVLGRGLYCMKITDNLDEEENEPEVKYTAAHHGDETTGIEMTMRLAELLASGYGVDPVLTDMVDKMEIWLCPIYNPDGYVNISRFNAHGEDLNRDFPDRITDPVDNPSGREPETQAFMVFGYDHRFSMGANYHGGAQVLNYPWDSITTPEYAPDDQLFFDFGLGYTTRNWYLWNGGWPYGMTRGWEWYIIRGGMQDWAYFWRDEHHVTLEISNTKRPLFENMDLYWEENRDAMLWWMQRAWTGLGGLVLDARNLSPLDGTVTLVGRVPPNTILTDPDVGDYHRVIEEGTYSLSATSSEYLSQEATVGVISGTVTSHNFYLCPEVPLVISGTVTDAISSEPLAAMVEFLGSHQVVNTDPTTGEYSIEVCPATYTMRVSAPWHYPEERLVNVDHSQIQDFVLLPTSNLSPSTKTASTTHPLPMEVVQYQLHVNNLNGVTSVTITDTLPVSVTWTGFLTATQGIPLYDAGQILWQGQVSQSTPVTITYNVTVNQCLPAETAYINIAEFNDGINGVINRKVISFVTNGLPTVPTSPLPMDGAIDQPASITLSWAPSTDLNCDPVTYDLYFGASPLPPLLFSGLTTPGHEVDNLRPATAYYWYVTASDGLAQSTSFIWSFSTAGERIFLPIAVK